MCTGIPNEPTASFSHLPGHPSVRTLDSLESAPWPACETAHRLCSVQSISYIWCYFAPVYIVQQLYKHSSPLLLSLLVRLYVSLQTLLTCVLHCLGSILPHAVRWVCLGMPLGDFLYLAANPSLDLPHHLRPIEAGLYSYEIHQSYVFCILLYDPGQYISL